MVASKLIKHPVGFWTLAEKPSPTELQDFYANRYYQEACGSYELRYSGEEKSYFRAKLEQRHAVIDRIAPAGREMLDVGCGEGFALSYFREQGWNVRGLDFSEAGVRAQNPGCLDALHAGDIFALLDDEIRSGRKYDVIWLQNVLEHVLEPLDLLFSLRNLVNEGGVMVVTVPNDFTRVQEEALAKGYIDHEFWVVPPEHISYFNHVTLKAAARAADWTCVELLADFPVEWFYFHEGSNYIRNKSRGKEAHLARIQLENLIHRNPPADVMAYWSAAARLGLGRGITGFFTCRSEEGTSGY
jgi:2-polyprenyl-3-methyl-5-hydroxy-6-metoxy-1,4-benzoquinol methylase